MKVKPKLYIVRTYVKALNVPDALRKVKNMKPDDVYVSDDWKEGKIERLESCMGFDDGRRAETEEDSARKR
jgi:hypothetical protein